MMALDDIQLSKAIEVFKSIGTTSRYENICRMNDDTLMKYKELLNEFKQLHESHDDLSTNEKGKKLEELVKFLLENSGGIFEVVCNVHTATNEIDQVIQLSQSGKPLCKHGLINDKYETFLGECKNYNKRIGVTYVGKFCSLLLTTGIRLGIMFSFYGVSGNHWSAGQGLIKKFYMGKERENDRFCIIDFSYDDFEAMANGNNFLQIIDDKLRALQLDTSYISLLKEHPATKEISDRTKSN